MAEYMQTPHLR